MQKKHIIAGFLIAVLTSLMIAGVLFVKDIQTRKAFHKSDKISNLSEDKGQYTYYSDEFGFRLRFPISWKGVRIEDDVRFEDEAIFSVLLPDRNKKSRIVFQIQIVPGEYVNTEEIMEMFGPIGEHIAHENNFTFVFRYVYGTELDTEPTDTFISQAIKDIDLILGTFETFSIKENETLTR